MFKFIKKYTLDIHLVIITTLLSNIGIFMIVPFLAIYLKDLNTISTLNVGTIIGVAFWFQRAGSIFGGILSDYFHANKTMLLGLLIRIPGYFIISYVNNFYLLILACSLIGLGSSIYLPAAKSFLVNKVESKNRVEILSIRIISSNIGVSIGPIIGLIVFKVSPIWLFTSVGFIFLFLFLFNINLNNKSQKHLSNNINFKDFYELLKNKNMITICIFMFIFMALYIQLEVTIPIFSKEIFNQNIVSFIFIINALIVIFFQVPISKWVCKENNKLSLIIGFLAFFISFLFLANIHNSYLFLFLAITIFSFAEIIFQIRLDYESTNIRKKMIATTFGITSLMGAFGGLFGSYIGVLLYSNKYFQTSLWAVLSIVTLFFLIISLVLLIKNINKKYYE